MRVAQWAADRKQPVTLFFHQPLAGHRVIDVPEALQRHPQVTVVELPAIDDDFEVCVEAYAANLPMVLLPNFNDASYRLAAELVRRHDQRRQQTADDCRRTAERAGRHSADDVRRDAAGRYFALLETDGVPGRAVFRLLVARSDDCQSYRAAGARHLATGRHSGVRVETTTGVGLLRIVVLLDIGSYVQHSSAQ